MTDESPSRRHGSAGIDLLTVAAIAVVAYAVTNLCHEGLGHGGAGVLVGGKPQVFNAIFFDSDLTGLSMGARRVVAAAGSVVNLVLAAAAYVGLRAWRGRPGPTHYFLWLMFALNLLMPFGYLLFSGIGGFGDWAVVVDGMQPAWLFRSGLAAVGAVLYFLVSPKLFMPDLNVYLGRDVRERAARARRLSLFPYLVGGASFVLAGVLNPVGWELVLISAAAASFGGTSLLSWYPGNADKNFQTTAPEDPAPLPRSVPWIVLGGVVLVMFVGVFGPGIKL